MWWDRVRLEFEMQHECREWWPTHSSKSASHSECPNPSWQGWRAIDRSQTHCLVCQLPSAQHCQRARPNEDHALDLIALAIKPGKLKEGVAYQHTTHREKVQWVKDGRTFREELFIFSCSLQTFPRSFAAPAAVLSDNHLIAIQALLVQVVCHCCKVLFAHNAWKDTLTPRSCYNVLYINMWLNYVHKARNETYSIWNNETKRYNVNHMQLVKFMINKNNLIYYIYIKSLLYSLVYLDIFLQKYFTAVNHICTPLQTNVNKTNWKKTVF